MRGRQGGPRQREAPDISVEPLKYREGDVVAEKYRLEQLMGEGAMGAVWRARNLALDVDVAVKLIHGELISQESIERLQREAHAAARLEHPSVVRVFDLGQSELGDPFIVMELLRGESLFDVLQRRETIPQEEAVPLILPVCAALSAAHSKGIVHRDLKPENIVIVENEDGIVPKVVDFGIAKVDSPRFERRSTTAGTILGSPDYMSPEQARGDDLIDLRTDIWSLGVVLYEIISGQPPFNAAQALALLRAIIETEPKTLEQLGVADPALSLIVSKAMTKDLSKRFPDMKSFGRSLAEWAIGKGLETDVTGASIAAIWTRQRPSLGSGSAFQSNPRISQSNIVSTPATSAPAPRPAPAKAPAPPKPPPRAAGVAKPDLAPPSIPSPKAASVPAPPLDAAPSSERAPRSGPPPLPKSVPPPLPKSVPPPLPLPVPEPLVLDTPPFESPEHKSVKPPSSQSDMVWTPVRRSRSKTPWILGVCAVAVIGAAAFVAVKRMNAEPTPRSDDPAAAQPTQTSSAPAMPPAAPTNVAASALAPPSSTSPGPSSSAAVFTPPSDVRACVASRLPAEALGPEAPVAAVCTEVDPRRGAALLHAEIAKNGLLLGKTTEAMQGWSRLSWYELAMFAVVRGACCDPATMPALKVPQSIGTCDPLGPTLDQLASYGRNEVAFDVALKSFRDVITCVERGHRKNTNLQSPYSYKELPGGAETAFRGIVERPAK